MDRSQSLNAPPFFDGSNYAFWKVRMRTFLCSIDESVWDFVENGYVRPIIAKSEWDKAALALANANSKAINAIFCGVSTDEFHRISHVKTVKEAWMIFETTYKGVQEKDGKDSQSLQGVVCFECNDHGYIKKECPNYLRGKVKVFATTLSDFESSNSNTEEECDSGGNYRAFMTITIVESKDDLSNLVNELGEHSEGEKVEELEDEDVCQNEGESNLQEAYDSLLDDCGKNVKMSPFKKSAVKGGNSKGKEPVTDLDSFTPKLKRTRSSIGLYDVGKFRSYAASQVYEKYFKDAPLLVERAVDQASLLDMSIPKCKNTECFKLGELPASGVVIVTLLAIVARTTSDASTPMFLGPPIKAESFWYWPTVKGKACGDEDYCTGIESDSILPRKAPNSGPAT
ncbi:uncharacterized protein LOC142644198 [Castanea sativa]|uniref:uncharacterized protein LOC142644198 n=1 Tax=Castanea sativa TaxID=21020 RepID=UPI003F64BB3E